MGPSPHGLHLSRLSPAPGPLHMLFLLPGSPFLRSPRALTFSSSGSKSKGPLLRGPSASLPQAAPCLSQLLPVLLGFVPRPYWRAHRCLCLPLWRALPGQSHRESTVNAPPQSFKSVEAVSRSRAELSLARPGVRYQSIKIHCQEESESQMLLKGLPASEQREHGLLRGSGPGLQPDQPPAPHLTAGQGTAARSPSAVYRVSGDGPAAGYRVTGQSHLGPGAVTAALGQLFTATQTSCSQGTGRPGSGARVQIVHGMSSPAGSPGPWSRNPSLQLPRQENEEGLLTRGEGRGGGRRFLLTQEPQTSPGLFGGRNEMLTALGPVVWLLSSLSVSLAVPPGAQHVPSLGLLFPICKMGRMPYQGCQMKYRILS